MNVKDETNRPIQSPHKSISDTGKPSAIILSGGLSKRFGEDKCLVSLLGKPLILYVYEKISPITNEVFIVINSKSHFNQYANFFKESILVIDEFPKSSPLIGAYTGFKHINTDYTYLLPCDTPLITIQVLLLLKETSSSADAVIPRHSNGYIEPLQAIYNTKNARDASKKAISMGYSNLRSMINLLDNVIYLPTNKIKKFDPKLLTFFNINTKRDLHECEKLLKISTSNDSI
jgi:molybdopterin-guanine dinucleotide biosynthesis protein A